MKTTREKRRRNLINSQGLVLTKTNHTQASKRSDELEQFSVHPSYLKCRRLRQKLSNAAVLAEAYFHALGIDSQQWLITLTYKSRLDWQPGQLSKFNNRLKSWARSNDIPIIGLWVMELQKRGAPHYHLVLLLPSGVTPPRPDTDNWWQHGFAKQQKASNAIPYMMKYSSKLENGDYPMPKGARTYGCFGLDKASRESLKYNSLPRWLRNLCDSTDKLVKLPGGVWLNATKGEIYKSPWKFNGMDRDGMISFERISDKPQIIRITRIADYLMVMCLEHARKVILGKVYKASSMLPNNGAITAWNSGFT